MRWIVLVLLVGCISPAMDPVAPEPAPGDTDPVEITVRPDGVATLAELEDFVDRAPRRYDNMFEHELSRQILEEAYASIGLNVTRQTFTGPAQNPAGGTVEGANIIATLPGRSDQTMMFGGHFDGAFNGYGAAYDDGLGTFIAVGLARAMAAYEWEHTLVFVAFDQEEAGLVGSEHFVAEMEDPANLTLYVNFDMTGINWPAKVGGVQDRPISALFGGEHQAEFERLWLEARDRLGYPTEATTTGLDLGSGSSDHGSFRAEELPAAWIRGALIGTYPGYHNADTVPTMIADVGGDRADLEAGIDAVMQMVFEFALLLDAATAQANA